MRCPHAGGGQGGHDSDVRGLRRLRYPENLIDALHASGIGILPWCPTTRVSTASVGLLLQPVRFAK